MPGWGTVGRASTHRAPQRRCTLRSRLRNLALERTVPTQAGRTMPLLWSGVGDDESHRRVGPSWNSWRALKSNSQPPSARWSSVSATSAGPLSGPGGAWTCQADSQPTPVKCGLPSKFGSAGGTAGRHSKQPMRDPVGVGHERIVGRLPGPRDKFRPTEGPAPWCQRPQGSPPSPASRRAGAHPPVSRMLRPMPADLRSARTPPAVCGVVPCGQPCRGAAGSAGGLRAARQRVRVHPCPACAAPG